MTENEAWITLIYRIILVILFGISLPSIDRSLKKLASSPVLNPAPAVPAILIK